MTKVIAALDNTPSGRTVLEAAGALARQLGSTVEAIHVNENGFDTASLTAATEHVRLRVFDGDVASEIVAATGAPDVVALAVGSRALSSGPWPAGHVTREVLASAAKPVLVVPPGIAPRSYVHKLLVPLDGNTLTSKAIARTMELIGDHSVDVVILHVLDASTLPPYNDQPQHETPAWSDEFVQCHCPWAATFVSPVELRVGVAPEAILDATRVVDPDLVLLGWSRDLSGGRAAVVRELLARGTALLLLVPVTTEVRALDPGHAEVSR